MSLTSLLGIASLLGLVYYAASIVILSLKRSRVARQNHCEPPTKYPAKDPIFGIDYQIATVKAFGAYEWPDFIARNLAKLGPTYACDVLGETNIVTTNTANVRSVLHENMACWGVPWRLSWEPLFEQSFFIKDGPIWKRSRDDIRPALSKAEFSDLGRLEGYVKTFLNLLPTDGDTFDFKHFTERLIQDYMSEFIFGKSIGSMSPTATTNEKELEVIHAVNYSATGLMERFMMGGLLGSLVAYLPVEKKLKHACRVIHEFIDERIDAAFAAVSTDGTSQQEKTKRVLVNDLVCASNDRVHLRSLATTVFFGGIDTTSNATSQVMWDLARAPRAAKKLRDEIATQLQGRTPTYADLQKLPYLRAVIDETLRLHPLVPALTRTALSDTILPAGGGPDGISPVFVPKGSICYLALTSLYHVPATWGQDAKEFRPERWFEMEKPAWTFLPFGAGGRVCPGQMLALTNVSYILVRIMQEFKSVEPRDDAPYKAMLGLVTGNASGYHLAMTRA